MFGAPVRPSRKKQMSPSAGFEAADRVQGGGAGLVWPPSCSTVNQIQPSGPLVRSLSVSSPDRPRLYSSTSVPSLRHPAELDRGRPSANQRSPSSPTVKAGGAGGWGSRVLRDGAGAGSMRAIAVGQAPRLGEPHASSETRRCHRGSPAEAGGGDIRRCRRWGGCADAGEQALLGEPELAVGAGGDVGGRVGERQAGGELGDQATRNADPGAARRSPRPRRAWQLNDERPSETRILVGRVAPCLEEPGRISEPC